MKRSHLNLTAEAWRNIRRDWQPATSARLLWQSMAVGPLLSKSYAAQTNATSELRARGRLDGAVVILGFWRSGTTLLHELLAAGGKYGFPTTHAAMNPQSWLLGGTPKQDIAVARPMDAMAVRANSPQEDEFALLGLGARTPYETLLVPERLAEVMRLADPNALSPPEREVWRRIFEDFVRSVSGAAGGLPLLLKSPLHAWRIETLRNLMPGCRFVLIVRDPYAVFESTANMWRSMFELYAMTAIPPDDAIRSAVLGHRPIFEDRLQEGLAKLEAGSFTTVRFEALIEDPGGTVARIHRDLGLPGEDEAVNAAKQEGARRASYSARARMPPEPWKRAIDEQWDMVFDRYAYQHRDV